MASPDNKMQPQNHERVGFSWYLSTNPRIFNPYNLSDRISRKTWYNNVTYPDLVRSSMIKKPAVPKATVIYHCEHHNLFTRLSCPKCNER
jgi:hypothetical protein